MQDRLGQPKALLHPLGVAVDLVVAAPGQPDQPEHLWNPRLALGIAPSDKLTQARKLAAERIIQAVREGKYKDRLSAMLALGNAWNNEGGSQP